MPPILISDLPVRLTTTLKLAKTNRLLKTILQFPVMVFIFQFQCLVSNFPSNRFSKFWVIEHSKQSPFIFEMFSNALLTHSNNVIFAKILVWIIRCYGACLRSISLYVVESSTVVNNTYKLLDTVHVLYKPTSFCNISLGKQHSSLLWSLYTTQKRQFTSLSPYLTDFSTILAAYDYISHDIKNAHVDCLIFRQ